MGQYPPLRHPAVQTGIEGVHLEDALSRIGPLVKQVVVHVTGRAAIGVHSPSPANTRENRERLAAASSTATLGWSRAYPSVTTRRSRSTSG